MPRKDGKVAIVTGGSKGIGYEVVRQMARLGAHVIIGKVLISAALITHSHHPDPLASFVASFAWDLVGPLVGRKFLEMSWFFQRNSKKNFVCQGLYCWLFVRHFGHTSKAQAVTRSPVRAFKRSWEMSLDCLTGDVPNSKASVRSNYCPLARLMTGLYVTFCVVMGTKIF